VAAIPVSESSPVEGIHTAVLHCPDGSARVVVEGVWRAGIGGPPPVLLVDDGVRRQPVPSSDDAPPDDPVAFRAVFEVPAPLVPALEGPLTLALGLTEVQLAPPSNGARPVDPAGPVVAVDQRRVAGGAERAPRRVVAAAAGAVALSPPTGGARAPAPDADTPGGGSVRPLTVAPDPPPEPEGRAATVVGEGVLEERRARRLEQLASDLEARAERAERRVAALQDDLRELEARLHAVTEERDRLRAQLEQGGLGVEDAPGAASSVTTLPGLEEAARFLRDESDDGGGARLVAAVTPARFREEEEAASEPAGDEPDPDDPFAFALAKLRAQVPLAEDAAADTGAAAPEAQPAADAVAATEAPPAEQLAPTPRWLPDSEPLLREHVLPFVITAQRPKARWLAPAIAALSEHDEHGAAQLVAQLLPDQARTLRRDLVYDLDLAGLGPLRVELRAGSGTVFARESESADAAFAVEASPAQFAPLAAGGAPWFPRGLRARRARRIFLPLTRLASTRRRPVSLADLAAAGVAPDPNLLLRALSVAVPPAWTSSHAFSVTVSISGHTTCRLIVDDGAPIAVLRVDRAGRRRAVVARAASHGPAQDEALAARLETAADAVLRTTATALVPLLGQAEPPEDEPPATVIGDLAAVVTLLRWFDRVQGLTPRA
jgi:hypothetical protein